MASKEVEVAQVPVVEAEEATEGAGKPSVVGELHIRVYDNGGLELHVPESSKEFSPEEIEGLTQIVHKQLYEQRLIKSALDAFKARLG